MTGKTLFIFPGQGSQYSGIGADLHERHASVRRTYEQASDTLGYDVASLSFQPSEDIHLTQYTQPVLLTHSVACLAAFQEVTGNSIAADATAGHSLGEYSALVAAGYVSFEAALKLVKKRGELMGELGEGEMLALALDLESTQPLASKHHVAIAACNLPEQTVVGGSIDDLARLEADVNEQFPKKSAVRLKTEGAFHTYYMIGAAREFRSVLEGADIAANDTQVLSNYSGGFHQPDPDNIRANLFWQLFHPVLWHRNLITAHEAGVESIIEFGGGIGKGEDAASKKPNLAAIVKRAYRGRENAPTYKAVINNETLEAFVS